MINFIFRLLLLLFLFIPAKEIIATQTIVQINNETFKDQNQNISNFVEYKLTNEKNYTPDGFKVNGNTVVNINYTNKYIYLRFNIRNTLDRPVHKELYFNSHTFKLNEVFLKNLESQKLSKFPLKKINANTTLHKSLRIELAPGEQQTIVIKTRSLNKFDTKVLLADTEYIQKEEQTKIISLSIYLGFMCTLLIYNLILGLINRESIYIVYSVFIFFMINTVLSISGFTQSILSLDNHMNYLGTFAIISCNYLYKFTKKLLSINFFERPAIKRLEKASAVISMVLIITILIPFFESYNFIIGPLVDIYILSLVVFIIYISIYTNVKQPTIESKVYLLSWLIMNFGIFAYFATIYGHFTDNEFTQNSILLGNMVESFTLSIALSLKINRLHKENEINFIKNLDQQKYIRLLRVLSHDIANSLFVIVGYSSRYLRRGYVEETRAWPKVYSACMHIKDILDNVKAEQELINNEPQLEYMKVKTLLDNIVTIFTPQCERKKIKIEIPETPEDLQVYSNLPILTHQILGNIISNSIKFTPNSGLIKISCTQVDQTLKLEVYDNGIGITKKKLDQIYKKTDTGISFGTLGEKGSGFGYFIIRSYCELLKIKFTIERKPVGTLVALYIPLNEHK
ncbi:7TM diverse intracellular signaling [Bacteriovorax sp. BAL6_X]|uniref:sensor histidine kinase n=1 Tax=Bacteriovorax sp. BAL6_X TaxID=1201290 RepID=UPI000386CB1F|nr:sensor histidine kinase [Bacteriovorax sp. BAL6_X]EPZ52410.1 7TM diverse intracellular signaling [Bacteriovorax sp. BAL6_X]